DLLPESTMKAYRAYHMFTQKGIVDPELKKVSPKFRQAVRTMAMTFFKMYEPTAEQRATWTHKVTETTTGTRESYLYNPTIDELTLRFTYFPAAYGGTISSRPVALLAVPAWPSLLQLRRLSLRRCNRGSGSCGRAPHRL
ncbi:MAG: hypothetical protein ACM3MF_08590, partial [Anaerolineae bacterium]